MYVATFPGLHSTQHVPPFGDVYEHRATELAAPRLRWSLRALPLNYDVERVDLPQHSAIDVAASRGLVSVVRALVLESNCRATSRTMMLACNACSVSTVRFLVTECGIDVNQRFENGLEPVVHAVRLASNAFELVRFLVEHGADVNPPGKASPLYDAAINKQPDAPGSVYLTAMARHDRFLDQRSADRPHVYHYHWNLLRYLVEKGARATKLFFRAFKEGSREVDVVKAALYTRTCLRDCLLLLFVPHVGERAIAGIVADYAVFSYEEWILEGQRDEYDHEN